MVEIGGLKLRIIRTHRVPEGRNVSDLPPGYGEIPTSRIRDYQGKCPASWDVNGYFLGLHNCEALWIDFQMTPSTRPVAVIMGAGGVNAVTGNPLGTVLEQGNYMVCPTQRWIDGFMCQGTVRQFIATEHKGGAGLTAGEQILGAASQTGALGFAVFQSNQVLHQAAPPAVKSFGLKPCGQNLGGYADLYAEKSIGANRESLTYTCHSPGNKGMAVPMGGAGRLNKPVTEMGLGAGGNIDQKIYPDPYGIHVWNPTPAATAALYICSAEDYYMITGQRLPAPHRDILRYYEQYFQVVDGHMATLPSGNKFDGLASPTGQPPASVFPGNTSNVK